MLQDPCADPPQRLEVARAVAAAVSTSLWSINAWTRTGHQPKDVIMLMVLESPVPTRGPRLATTAGRITSGPGHGTFGDMGREDRLHGADDVGDDREQISHARSPRTIGPVTP